jgi:hypothetical protein
MMLFSAQHSSAFGRERVKKKFDNSVAIDQVTLDAWSAPYRGWHYYSEPVIPSDLKIPGYEKFRNFELYRVKRKGIQQFCC